MKRVLIGACGSSTGFGIIKSLRFAWPDSVYILATDTNPDYLVAASTFCDAYEQVPCADSSQFVLAISHYLTKYRIDTLCPVHDLEIEKISSSNYAEKIGSVMVVSPNKEAVSICNDKLNTLVCLDRHRIPVAFTWIPNKNTEKFDNKIFVKPRYGVGSRDAFLCSSRSQLDRALKKGVDLVAQEVCSSPEITVDAFVSRNSKRHYAICRERLEVKAGVCTKAKIYADPEISALVPKVAAATGLSGSFCLQLMARRTGDLVITDINPRTGGGTAMSLAVGTNFPAASFADLWGLDISCYLPILDRDHYVVRQYTEFVTL